MLKTKRALSIGLCLFALISTALAEDVPRFWGEINGDDINIRADSTLNAIVLCKASRGEKVEVVSERYDWYKIKLPRSVPAYVKKDLVEVMVNLSTLQPNQPVAPVLSEQTAKVLKDNVNIRFSPSESAAIIGQVKQNEVVRIQEEQSGWYRINPPDSCFGWVHKQLVKKSTSPIVAEKPTVQAGEKSVLSADGTIEAMGVIQPYGMVFMRKATHKLITADKKVYLLKSEKKTLDSLNQRKVKVFGKVSGDPAQNNPLIIVDKIEVVN